jgi:hypothetical protein
MSRNQRQLRLREFAVYDMQVGTAHGAGAHAYQDLARSWCGHRDGLQAERLSRRMKQHDTHLLIIAVSDMDGNFGSAVACRIPSRRRSDERCTNDRRSPAIEW